MSKKSNISKRYTAEGVVTLSVAGWDDLRVVRVRRGAVVSAPSYKNHRYPAEVISHCVRLYFRFPLSFREVEELMLERGVIASYETVRRWCLKFVF